VKDERGNDGNYRRFLKQLQEVTLKILIALGGMVFFLLTGCTGSPADPAELLFEFSFEESLEGWHTRGIDLELGQDTIQWSITQSSDRATDRSTSLKFYLNNLNDADKIWVEKKFSVRPGTRYRVSISYDFASRDNGTMNLFTVIPGVLPRPPRTREELAPTFQGSTGNGSDSDSEYIWTRKEYGVIVESGETGELSVVIGVWGTWETPRTYYLDHLRITFDEH